MSSSDDEVSDAEKEQQQSRFADSSEDEGDSASDDDDKDAANDDTKEERRAKFEDAKTKGFESDLGHMAAFNTAPLDPSAVADPKTREAYLRRAAKQSAELLFRDLISLPSVDDSQTLRELPEPTFKLPRHKPLPKPKPETRWEKYAREKGITNRKKRDRMIWDERTQAFAPRWGMGRANDDQKDWLVEVKPGDDPETDVFAERRQQKKLRVLKNRARFLRNQSEAGGGRSAAAAGDAAAEVLNLGVEGARAGASKRGKKAVGKALTTAQVSTASLGRFDREMEGEPKRELRVSRKRKFAPAESTKDLSRDQKILGRLLGKHIGGDEGAEAPKKAKKGKGRAAAPGKKSSKRPRKA